MKIENIDLDRDIMIIAEIGNNHEGSYSVAEELIGKAAEAGADAVKFQTFKTEYYVSADNKERFERLKSFELSYDEFRKLADVAKSEDIIFLSTPFDMCSASFLNEIVPAFKISSGDNSFYPLLKYIASFNKQIILSSGLTDLNEIKYSKGFIEKAWRENGFNQDIAVLHCVCSYPVQPCEVNLAAIKVLKDELKCTVGYSDHTIGIESAVLSVAFGASIIEKHFTLDKNFSDFRDHILSADPIEMKRLVQKVKETSVMIGKPEKKIQESEAVLIESLRRRIVAKRDLSEGKIITMNDITWVRKAGGFPAGRECQLLGKRLLKPLKSGDEIIPDVLAESD